MSLAAMLSGRQHIIASRRAELAAGFGLFLAGALLVRDAYDSRGIEQPFWLRPFTFL